MTNTYKNIVITPNIGSNTADPKVVYSGGNTTTNTDITLYVYPDSNGSLSWEGSAGQLFSITNDLTGSIFSVNDVSGIPLVEVNVASQQITLGQFYGNVGIGTGASNSSIYKLDVTGSANISLPTLLVAGQNVLASFASINAYANVVGTAANTFANTKLANTNVVLAGNLTSTQGIADRVGDLRNLPIINQSSSYTLSLADNGEVISITTGNVFVTAGIFFPGNTVSIFNNSSANITITQNTSVTMYSAGTSNTGNRILQQRGIATLVCVAANTFVVTGAGMVS